MQLTINIKDPSQESFIFGWLMQHSYIELSVPQYTDLSFLSPEQNAELNCRLKRLENNETKFIGLDEFKKKYQHYVQD